MANPRIKKEEIAINNYLHPSPHNHAAECNFRQILLLLEHFWLFEVALTADGDLAFDGDDQNDYEKNAIYLTERIHQMIDDMLGNPPCDFTEFGVDDFLRKG